MFGNIKQSNEYRTLESKNENKNNSRAKNIRIELKYLKMQIGKACNCSICYYLFSSELHCIRKLLLYFWFNTQLTILTWKNLCFAEFSTKFIEMQGWLPLAFLICLHNQLSSFNSIIVQMPEKRDSSSRQ